MESETMRTILLPLILAFLSASASHATETAGRQYIIHVKVMQRSEGEPGKCKVLVAPTLVTTGDRPINFSSAEKVTLLGEEVDKFGTEFTMRASPLANGSLVLRGTIEVSQLAGPPTDYGVTTTRQRMSFNRQVALNRATRFFENESATWLEVMVEEVPASTASR
jgi:hypothetical protein